MEVTLLRDSWTRKKAEELKDDFHRNITWRVNAIYAR